MVVSDTCCTESSFISIIRKATDCNCLEMHVTRLVRSRKQDIVLSWLQSKAQPQFSHISWSTWQIWWKRGEVPVQTDTTKDKSQQQQTGNDSLPLTLVVVTLHYIRSQIAITVLPSVWAVMYHCTMAEGTNWSGNSFGNTWSDLKRVSHSWAPPSAHQYSGSLALGCLTYLAPSSLQ